MNKLYVLTGAVLFCCGSLCFGQILTSVTTLNERLELGDGVFKVDDEFEGFTKLTKTNDGHLFEIFTLTDSDRLSFDVTWEEDRDSWNFLTIDRLELDGEDLLDEIGLEFFLRTTVEFDPWRRPGETALIDIPRVYAFPPLQDSNHLILQPCRGCSEFEEEGHNIVLEYSLKLIPTPLPADFNYDGRVDFSDFLILSENFNRSRGEINKPVHFRGDANFDFRTDFEDYLILRGSFGSSRVQAVAAPEPSGLATAALMAFGLAVERRRRWI